MSQRAAERGLCRVFGLDPDAHVVVPSERPRKGLVILRREGAKEVRFVRWRDIENPRFDAKWKAAMREDTEIATAEIRRKELARIGHLGPALLLAALQETA